MKILCSILIGLLGLQAAVALSLSEIQVAYQAQIIKIDEERKASIDTLQKGYLKALERFQETFQKEGDLKRALQIKREIEQIETGTWPLAPLPEEIDHRVGPSRKIYLKNYINFDRDWAMSTIKASDKMLAILKEKRIELTKAGDLEQAKKAQMLIDVIDKDPEVVRARELPRRVSQGGHSKAAYIVRRGGDHLEVLVKFDSTGKVSLDSPVENITEKTDGKKEKGETKAKTLGEFVGAKGYEVDPYVSFNESAESGKLEFTEMVGSTARKSTQVEGGPAIEIKLGNKVANAYFRLAGVLSPLAEPATHRLTCDYFVPKDNHKVIGLNFQHGGASGKPIGQPITTAGKWETASLLGESGAPEGFLTGYFRGPSFKEMPASGGDRVYLRNLKIEHIKFSAFVVESFGSNGNTTLENTDSASQQMIVRNGVLQLKD